jgi:hypothetical protein
MKSSHIVFTAVVLSLLAGAPALAQEQRNCNPPPPNNEPLAVRDGYAEFMSEPRVAPWKARLPRIADAKTDDAMRSVDTMWYDEDSMVFAYQDSIEVVVGIRANCVGRRVGETNRNNPDIAKLMNYFGPDYRFMFPFRKAAGTDNVTNVKVMNFWNPPRKDGRVMPVKWWKMSSRGRWRWVFPVGTIFGEVLFQKNSAGEWFVFEVRTRTRYREGWAVNVFRPFRTAEAMAGAIMGLRPQWDQDANLRTVVGHLRTRDNLVAHRFESRAFSKVFAPIDGALDRIPAIADETLVEELLTRTPFISTEGAIWKEGAGLETYAPSSQGEFSIVPRNYEMGMIAVNEVSCERCHSETSRRLGTFDTAVILYGEVWGEDRIFTWHLFEPHRKMYFTFDDEDGSRRLNPRLERAGLLRNERPSSSDPDYKELPSPF